MKLASHMLIDTRWYLRYQENPDGTVTIIKHWSPMHGDEPLDAPDPTGMPSFRLEELPGRVVHRAIVGPKHKDGSSPAMSNATTKVYVVANPKNVFDYKGDA